MRKQTRVLVLALTIASFGLNAQTRYEQEMKTTIDALDKAENLMTFKSLANKFEAISKVEKDRWLPKYYVSYTYTVMAHFEKETDSKDKSLEVAQRYFNEAKDQSGDKEELAILQTYIHQSDFFASPMARLKTFLATSSEIDDLLKLYPNNPRLNLLEGIQLFHKPSFLGGGASKAKPFLQKAAVNYIKQQSMTSLDPAWGKSLTTYYLQKCI
ncbi:hypothetical protein ADIARSV_0800 [Arcticibacter svalbardensis MN12-7]|uniref:Uncharacterized protein n=2 Tax=Arcticibacter TaxID=1288026 RepID=R9H471_9SPHI|nr:hypothetical protein ADIARSV_0800 [Arcticibacter svalbardensis MN12-7]